MPFPISDFLHDEPNELRLWDFRQDEDLTVAQLVQELQAYQPVVLGISDHRSTNGLVLERLIKQMFPRALVFFSADALDRDNLLDRANHSSFRLRQRTRPVAGKMRFRSAWDPATLFADLPEAQQPVAWELAQALEQRYALQSWRQLLPLTAYRQVLETLELLEDCFPSEHPLWDKRQVRLLDIDAGRWSYAPALYQFFVHAYTEQPRQVFLTGVELDPYRLDPEGYSCVDYALSYIDPIASYTRYLNQNVMEHTAQQPYDVITQFRPYMFCQEHLFAGLPLEFFRPREVFLHALSLAQPGGSLVITHAHAESYFQQQELFKELGYQPSINGAFRSRLSGDVRGFVSRQEAGSAV